MHNDAKTKQCLSLCEIIVDSPVDFSQSRCHTRSKLQAPHLPFHFSSSLFIFPCHRKDRDDWIRTSDFLLPKQVLCQAELRPVNLRKLKEGTLYSGSWGGMTRKIGVRLTAIRWLCCPE